MNGPSPLHKEADCFVLGEHFWQGVDRWERKGLDRQFLFPAQVKRSSAGRQELHGWTGEQQGRNEVGDHVEQMLTVVEEQQGLPRAKLPHELLVGGQAGDRDDAERPGHGRRDELRVHER